MTSSQVLPPSYRPDDSLPDYCQTLQLDRSPEYPTLDLLASSQGSTSTQANPLSGEFVFESKRLGLHLGPRQWGHQLPVYGRNGLIEGQVVIKTFKLVDRVEVSLTGTVLSHTFSNGAPSHRSSLPLLFEKSTIWSFNKRISIFSFNERVPDPESSFPFAFTLPDHASGSGFEYSVTSPLPPSASVKTRTSNVHVFYCLRVDMYRQSPHSHDSVQTEILYLPRTTFNYVPPYVPPPSSEKSQRICDSEWRTVEVPRSSCAPKTVIGSPPSLSDVTVHLSLPRKLRFPSGCDIPFAVTLGGSGLLGANTPQLIAGLKLTLVETATTIVQKAVSKEESIVSTGRICRIDEDDHHWCDSTSSNSTPHLVVRGSLGAGTRGKIMSWNIPGHVGVMYHVRVSLAPSVGPQDEAASVMWEHKEAVVITSHEWEGQAATGLPALSLEAASRSPMSISLMSGT